MTPTEAALRAEVAKAVAHCNGACECDSYIACADTVVSLLEAALAAPPHGKDAGEEPEYVTPLTCRVCWDDGLDECSHAALQAQRDALQARLAVAEGLIGRAGRYIRSRNALSDLAAILDAFLKEGGKP